MGKVCTKCNQELPDIAVFCSSCGERQPPQEKTAANEPPPSSKVPMNRGLKIILIAIVGPIALTIFVLVLGFIITRMSQTSFTGSAPDINIPPNTTEPLDSDPNPPPAPTTSVDEQSPDSAKVSDKTLLAAYKSYHNILREAVNEYGAARTFSCPDYNEDFVEGLLYAELVDFNDDDLPELLYIYGYRDSEDYGTTSIHEAKIYGYSTQAELYAVYQSIWSFMDFEYDLIFGIATGKDNTQYFAFDGYYHNSWGFSYFGIKNGVWDLLLEIYGYFDFEVDEEVTVVNGTKVSYEEYTKAPQTHLGIVDERWIDHVEGQSSVLFVIRELESRIATLENQS